jgi:putative glutamine amidotransferase
MAGSMDLHDANRPRIGVPWRTAEEERAGNLPKIRSYLDAVEKAGGSPELLSLGDPERLERQILGLDGFVLPGSPADVEPAEYGAVNQGQSEPADLPRERTDRAILSHAFQAQKPVLAICYGCQLLNVYLGGTLVQDLQSETGTQLPHRKKDIVPEAVDDPRHAVSFTAGSRLAKMARGMNAVVNSSHHQSVLKPGRQLQISGLASDGTVESVEWTGDANWVVGVQWHPERMAGDALADQLFAALVTAAKGVHAKT